MFIFIQIIYFFVKLTIAGIVLGVIGIPLLILLQLIANILFTIVPKIIEKISTFLLPKKLKKYNEKFVYGYCILILLLFLYLIPPTIKTVIGYFSVPMPSGDKYENNLPGGVEDTPENRYWYGLPKR